MKYTIKETNTLLSDQNHIEIIQEKVLKRYRVNGDKMEYATLKIIDRLVDKGVSEDKISVVRSLDLSIVYDRYNELIESIMSYSNKCRCNADGWYDNVSDYCATAKKYTKSACHTASVLLVNLKNSIDR